MSAPRCTSCGFPTMYRETDRTETITCGNLSTTVDHLTGWFCPECHDGWFDDESSRRYGQAGDALVMQHRENMRREVRRIRRKLGLTQKEAAGIFGGGVNAFSRYERGEVEPGPSTVKLLHLLDKHPELLPEVVSQ